MVKKLKAKFGLGQMVQTKDEFGLIGRIWKHRSGNRIVYLVRTRKKMRWHLEEDLTELEKIPTNKEGKMICVICTSVLDVAAKENTYECPRQRCILISVTQMGGRNIKPWVKVRLASVEEVKQ